MWTPTASHWGNYRINTLSGKLADVEGYAEDLNPTPLARNLLASQDPSVRVAQPSIRKSYLD